MHQRRDRGFSGIHLRLDLGNLHHIGRAVAEAQIKDAQRGFVVFQGLAGDRELLVQAAQGDIDVGDFTGNAQCGGLTGGDGGGFVGTRCFVLAAQPAKDI